jgi:hypothetical protein
MYLAPQTTSDMTSLLLNSLYETGNLVGPILGWVFGLLMVIELIYVMVKYLGSGK